MWSSKGPFTYYVITEGEGGGLQMITLHVIVSNTATVKVIMEGERGVENRPKSDNLICERSLITRVKPMLSLFKSNNA